VVDIEGHIVLDKIDKDKQRVQDFYDSEGWVKNETGNYQDAVLFEDLRDVSKDYIRKCHERVSRYLPSSGKYILDAASGALQYAEYLQYSSEFKYRICVDLSFKALVEAKKKLGERGICILCDMTNLPFKDEVIDGFVSMNTIFHIPKDEQANAINELYRVLLPGGKGVVVYDWFKHSTWMNIWMLPFRGFVFLKNRLLDGFGKMLSTKGVDRKLYFYAHPPAYFKEHLPAHEVKVWRTLSVHFMRYYIHPWLFGKQILQYVYEKEENNPERCGLKGEYPLLVFEKACNEAPASVRT
jgi:ubiquinone/menaquinone biosynthesis C-methylase UbiE